MIIEKAYAKTDPITIQNTSNTPQTVVVPVESGWTSLVPMVLIFVVFYFLLIRPQEKKRHQQKKLVSEVKKGEEIVTNSGIFGIVSKINGSNDTIQVRIAKDVEVKMFKNSITEIVSRNSKEVNKGDNKIDQKQIQEKKNASPKKKSKAK